MEISFIILGLLVECMQTEFTFVAYKKRNPKIIYIGTQKVKIVSIIHIDPFGHSTLYLLSSLYR